MFTLTFTVTFVLGFILLARYEGRHYRDQRSRRIRGRLAWYTQPVSRDPDQDLTQTARYWDAVWAGQDH